MKIPLPSAPGVALRPGQVRPITAWLVTWGPVLLAAALLAVAAPGVFLPSWELLAIFLLLSIAAEHFQIPLASGGSQTFGPAVALPAIVILGPVPAAVIGALGAAIGNGVLRRRALDRAFFETGQCALAALLAGATWNLYLRHAPGFDRVSPDLAGHAGLAATAAVLAVYAPAPTVQAGLFLAAIFEMPLGAVLLIGALWRIPTAAALGASGLSIAIAIWGGEAPVLLIPLVIASLIALLFTSHRQDLRESTALHEALTDLLETHDLDALLSRLADKVARLTKPDALWITLRNSDDSYEIALERGLTPAQFHGGPAVLPNGASGWALTHRRPLRIADYQRDARRTAESQAAFPDDGVRAVLIVPLLAGSDPVGLITVTKPIPGFFTAYQERVVSTFAAQAALVVNNARLYTKSREDLTRVEALKAISERINSQQDLQAVFDTIADWTHEVLKADRCGLYLGALDKEITHTFARGLGDDDVRNMAAEMQSGIGLTGLTLRLGEPVIIADAHADGRANVERARRVGYRTIATFPLVYRSGAIGVLALYHDAARLYGSSETALGGAVANQVAIAVQNALLLEEAERKAHQLGLLNRTFTRVASTLHPSELLDALVEELHTTLNYPLVLIGLLDGDQIQLTASRGYTGLAAAVPVTTGVIGRVARTGSAALVADVRRDPDFNGWDPRVTQQACVPIVSHEKVVGVISIEGIETKLTPADLDLLTTLAGYVSIALEKAQLYERTQVLATTDGLTGLLNYRAFWQALERELERSMRYGVPLSLIMIEIDQFKRFNDTYGHLRGDEVIRLVARVLQQEHRTQIDTIARYGGDEFMILLPHTAKTAAAEIAERVRRAVRAAPLSAAMAGSVTLSLGVAAYPEDGKSTEALIEGADRSMYRAKTSGGNSVAVANPS